MEIEQKFRVDDDGVFLALRDMHEIAGYTLHAAAEPERQHNIYFDTADGRLKAQRHGLRIREIEGGERIVTLKGPASGAAGRFVRNEWEVAIGDAGDAPDHWPPSEARTQTLALVGAESLVRILTIDTVRYHSVASTDIGEVAELSLDEGSISAGGRTETFRELEIELKGSGTTVDLDAICAALQERFVLVPDDRGKLQRGLALLEAVS